MEKFLKKFDEATDHGHCIIKEELMIADSDEEIDVEKVDKEIYSIPKNASCLDSEAEIDFEKRNKVTKRKRGRSRTKISSADNKKQTTLNFFVKSKNVDSNNEQSQNSIDPEHNMEPTPKIKTAECDIDTLTKKMAKSYCKKCKKERPVIRQKARCNKCKTQLSYVCNTCDKTYSTFTDLGYHLKIQHLGMRMTHTCNLCNKTFSYKKGLLYHRKTQHKNIYQSLKCSMCGKNFNEPADKIKHENVCDQQAEYKSKKCSICGEVFNRPLDKERHEKACGNRRNQCDFKCDKCPYIARYKSNLNRHTLAKHSGFTGKCENCPKVFTNNRSLWRHMKIYCNKTKNLECHHCGHKFYRKDQIVNHINQFHMEGCNTNSNTAKKTQPTKICQYCGLSLAHYEQMKYHVLRCKSGLTLASGPSKKKPRICKHCGLTLARFERMKCHKIRCQSGLPLDRKGLRICKYCGETMKPREHMRYHVERCESAPLALRYTAERAKLPDMDTALKELAISYCVKCETKEPLKKQGRRCGECNKSLRFACVSCPKNFVDTIHLHEHLRRQHVRTLKFYRCNECRCSYNRKHNLIAHIRANHSDKLPTTNFKCEKCGKEYKSRATLRKHKISCIQEPKFYCDKCPYKTHFKSCIIEHIWAKRATCI